MVQPIDTNDDTYDDAATDAAAPTTAATTATSSSAIVKAFNEQAQFRAVTNIWATDDVIAGLKGWFGEYAKFKDVPRALRAAPDATWAGVQLWLWWLPPTSFSRSVGCGCTDNHHRVVCKSRKLAVWVTMLCGLRAEETSTLPRLPEELWLCTFEFLKHDQPPTSLASLHVACRNGNVPTVNELLREHSIDVNTRGQVAAGVRMTPLHVACCTSDTRSDHTEIIKLLLMQKEIDANKGTIETNETPLYAACNRGHPKAFRSLLAHKKIDVNKGRTDNGGTPLYTACSHDRTYVIKLLLEQKLIDVNKPTSGDGATPLYIACDQGHPAVVRLLLAHPDVDVNQAATDDGSTPLFVVCFEGHLEIVKLLLAHKAIKVNIANNEGDTPIAVARFNGHTEIVELLEQKLG